MVIAEVIEANKIYPSGDSTITALQKTTLQVHEGELMLIIGPSGSGKTTLLSLIGCVIYPTEGEVWVDGRCTNDMDGNQLAALRLNTIGFVFQGFNLILPLTAQENIALPLQMQGIDRSTIEERVDRALHMVHMETHRAKLPRQLSGGEQQRIAIARALVGNPKIVLCDEPTASLDKKSLHLVMRELKGLAEKGKAVCAVTHDPRLKEYADRIIEVKDGFAYEVNECEPTE